MYVSMKEIIFSQAIQTSRGEKSATDVMKANLTVLVVAVAAAVVEVADHEEVETEVPDPVVAVVSEMTEEVVAEVDLVEDVVVTAEADEVVVAVAQCEEGMYSHFVCNTICTTKHTPRSSHQK